MAKTPKPAKPTTKSTARSDDKRRRRFAWRRSSKTAKSKRKTTSQRSWRPRLPAYVRESIAEIKKVAWPTRRDAWKMTFAVFVFTAIFTLITVVADYGFQRIAERLFL